MAVGGMGGDWDRGWRFYRQVSRQSVPVVSITFEKFILSRLANREAEMARIGSDNESRRGQ